MAFPFGGGLALIKPQVGHSVRVGGVGNPVSGTSPSFEPSGVARFRTQPDIPSSPANLSPDFTFDATTTSTLPSQLTLTATGSRNYFDTSGVLQSAASNVVRFDNKVGYDGTSIVPAGLLIEDQRTNSCLQAFVPTNASWILASGTKSAGQTDIRGGTNAVTFTALAAAGTHDIEIDTIGTLTNGVTYTMRCYVSKGTATHLFWGDFTDTTNLVWASLRWSDMSVSTNGQDGAVASGPYLITVVGGVPVYAIDMTWTRVGTAAGSVVCGVYNNHVTALTGTQSPSWTPAGTETFKFYGAMVYDGPSKPMQSPILTTTAAVTRSADILSSTDAGLLAEKAWVVESGELAAGTASTLLGINTVVGIGEDASSRLTTADGGTQTSGNPENWRVVNRGGIAWDSTPRVSVSLNGWNIVTATNTAVTPTTLYFGNTNNGASGFLNGHLRMMAAYAAADDTQLQALTPVNASFTIGTDANVAVAQTLGALVTAATDTVLAQATIAQTLGALGQAATATVLDQAVVAQTLSALTQAATATAPASVVTAQTLGPLGQTAAATAPLAITIAQNLGALTQATAGTVSVSAAAAQTLGAIIQAATGGVIDQATAAQTLGALAQAAAATAPAALTAAQALGTLGQAAASTNLDHAVVNQTLDALGQSVAATHPDSAVVAQNLGALTNAATGTVLDQAAAVQTLGAIVQTATAGAVDTATAAQTLGVLAQAATATAPLAIAASQTLGVLAQAATGTVTDAAIVAQALGALVQSASGTVVSSATVSQALGSLVQTATATAPNSVALSAAQTLGALGQALTGTAVDTATVAQSLGALGQSAAAAGTDSASAAQTLGAIVQATTGAVIDAAAVSQALGALNQTAAATTASGFVAAQTLGGIVQALTGTAIDAATVAQALGGLGQSAASGVIATVLARTDTLGPLGQAATGGAVARANVAQVLAALLQVATADLPQAHAIAGQILGALQQVAVSTVPENALAVQALSALGQSAAVSPITGVTVGQILPGLRQGPRFQATIWQINGSEGQRRKINGAARQDSDHISGSIASRIIVANSASRFSANSLALENGMDELLMENGTDVLLISDQQRPVTKISGAMSRGAEDFSDIISGAADVRRTITGSAEGSMP